MKSESPKLANVAASPYLLLALASLFWSGNHIVGRASGDTAAVFSFGNRVATAV
jgi:hypothetical protein